MLRYVKHIGRRFKNGFREVRRFCIAMMCVALWYLKDSKKGRCSTCSQEAFESQQSDNQDVEVRNRVDSVDSARNGKSRSFWRQVSMVIVSRVSTWLMNKKLAVGKRV